MKFIKLTQSGTERTNPIYVNMDLVLDIEDIQGVTYLSQSENYSIKVKETPKEILDLCTKETKF